MKKSHLLICFAIMIIAGFCMSCGKNKNMHEPQVKFETKVLKLESRTYNMTFPATLEGTSEVKVYPQVEGIVKVKKFTSGTKVTKGQTLFVIDPTEYL